MQLVAHKIVNLTSMDCNTSSRVMSLSPTLASHFHSDYSVPTTDLR